MVNPTRNLALAAAIAGLALGGCSGKKEHKPVDTTLNDEAPPPLEVATEAPPVAEEAYAASEPPMEAEGNPDAAQAVDGEQGGDQ